MPNHVHLVVSVSLKNLSDKSVTTRKDVDPRSKPFGLSQKIEFFFLDSLKWGITSENSLLVRRTDEIEPKYWLRVGDMKEVVFF